MCRSAKLAMRVFRSGAARSVLRPALDHYRPTYGGPVHGLGFQLFGFSRPVRFGLPPMNRHLCTQVGSITKDTTMAKQEELMLLDFWASLYGMRVRIALAEKGIPYEYNEQDLKNKSQLLLDMNPVYKKIPVLIHNGNPICESSLIVEYIDEVWKDKAPLFPSDTLGKARARLWAGFIDRKLYQIGYKLYTTKGQEHQASRKKFMECLKLLEGVLGGKPYFAGESFGYLDVSLIPFYSWFHAFETYGNFNVELECPALIAWAKRCIRNKESVSNTLPDQQKVLGYIHSIAYK